MPPNRNSVPQVIRRRGGSANEPPKVMTWAKAMPILVVAGVFDALRAFFEMFWFFGPALAAVTCAVGVNSYTGASFSTTGGQVTSGLCAAAAMVGGAAAAVPIETFGVVMSEALGLLGFLTLGLWIVMKNPRLFKAQATGLIWFMGSFAMSEIPFIGTIPAFTIALWRLYKTQIKVEKAALKKWQEENQGQLQEQQTARIQYEVAQQAQFAQLAQQEAANEAETKQNEEDQEGGGEQNVRDIRPGVRRGGDGGSDEQQEQEKTVPAAVDFSTMHDALSELNTKMDRTREENLKLIRAQQIMQGGLADVNETDPVLQAARSRALQGQGIYDQEKNPNGFKFNIGPIPGNTKIAA